jgi:mono/diheme cytochrome c family protein
MSFHRLHLGWVIYALASPASAGDFFVSKIEPLLKQRCFECHSHEKKIKGGLALDSKSGWEKGGESGPAIVPGKPGASLLIKAVSHAEKDLKMPPKKMLPLAEIELLAEWVRQGAPDPRVTETKVADLAATTLGWWSFKSVSTGGASSR